MPWKDRYTTSDEKSLTDDQLRWHDGKRCCALITVDLSLATTADGVTARDLTTDRAMFGLNEGFDAVTSLLARFGLSATFAVPGVMAGIYGERLADLQSAGHEIAVHGLKHENVADLPRAEEAERMAAATDMVARVTGQQPRGWYSLPRQSDPFAVGTVSEHTIELLADSDYEYFCPGLADDIPYYWVSSIESQKTMLTLPYYYHFDDQFFLMFPRRGTGLEHADGLHANWLAEFDAQRERGRCFSMVLHPHAVAWCNRRRRLEQFFAHMTERHDVWTPTGSACAEHWRSRYPATDYLKLEPSIWRDHAGSLS